MTKTFRPALFFCLLLIGTGLGAQTAGEYVFIPRTHVSLQMPAGYKLMDVGQGLVKNAKEAVFIIEMAGTSFYAGTKTFTKEAYEQKGVKVYSYEEFQVNGYPAKLMVSSTDDPALNGFSMVFGDSAFAVMVTSVHKAADNENEKKLKAILQQMRYDPQRKINPFEGVRFSVDTASTSFRFLMSSGGFFVYTPGAQEKPANEALVMLSVYELDSVVTLSYLTDLTIQSMGKFGIYGFLKRESAPSVINGNNALLTAGDAYVRVTRKYLSIVAASHKKYGVVLLASCKYDDEAMRKELAAFCASLKIN